MTLDATKLLTYLCNRFTFGKLWHQESLLVLFPPSSFPFCSRCPLLVSVPHLNPLLAPVLRVWFPAFTLSIPHPEIWFCLPSWEPLTITSRVNCRCWQGCDIYFRCAGLESLALNEKLWKGSCTRIVSRIRAKTKGIKCEEQVFRHVALGRVRGSRWHFEIPEICHSGKRLVAELISETWTCFLTLQKIKLVF